MENSNLIHNLENQDNTNKLSLKNFLLILVVVILAGTITGFVLTKINKNPLNPNSSQQSTSKEAAGIADKKTFKDKAEGLLKEGGIDGEGNFHLKRSGGESQNVYLTSTTVDLSQYINKKVRVWGETFQGSKAGWLMDVGFVEILQ